MGVVATAEALLEECHFEPERLPQAMEQAPLQERALAAKLLMEHEMGELFQVLLLAKGAPWEAVGFAHGDRSHRL